jgi:hypothetical protein
MDGQKVQMQFDANSLVHIMSILTDLYSDPELAVIREYSTNALDSHAAAKNSRPIEVSLPGSLSPFFKVKDYGVGMSVGDIESIYSKYGASTKRATDEQVGMLGLGCKSALTYVTQFTVTAVKGGVKTQVSVGRNEDGSGTMEIVDTVSTNEPNGVEITVPVRNINSFNEKANRFFAFWDKNVVLINGKPPVVFDSLRVTDDIFINRGANDSRDYVVMGNVAYPVEPKHGISDQYSRSYGVVSYVPIGSVHFTPSRESLHYTSTTLTTLSRIKANFVANLDGAISRDISTAPTHLEALKKSVAWKRIHRNSALKVGYKGLDIPTEFYFSDVKGSPVNGTTYFPNMNRRNTNTNIGFSVADIFTSVIITGHDKAVTATYKSKVKIWAENSGLSPRAFIFVDKPFGLPWLEGIPTVTSDEIKKTALPAQNTGYRGANKAIPGSFLVWDAQIGWKERNDLSDEETLVYVDHGSRDSARTPIAFLAKNKIDVTLVAMPSNRLAKFLRENPSAKPINALVLPLIESARDNLTKKDIDCLAAKENIVFQIELLDLSKVDDPYFKEYVDLAAHRKTSRTLNNWLEAQVIMRTVYSTVSAPIVPNIRNPFSDYPLLTIAMSSSYNVQTLLKATDIYLYLNTAYAAKKD